MTDHEKLTRRGFIAGGIGALAAGAALAQTTVEGKTDAPSKTAVPRDAKVPSRKYGKTGIEVPILALGGMFDIISNQALLKKAYDWGVRYFDTAQGYENGNSEIGFGNFFEKFPETRKNLFLVTKSGARNPQKLTDHLNTSLQKLKTDTIDLFFFHGMSGPADLTDELKAWAEKAKAEKKIRLIGFSTHKNMETLLAHAAKLGWIDGIMLTYNYRNMNSNEMKAGIEACHKAGIGITAMKTQARGPEQKDPMQLDIVDKFVEKGFTPQQAKLKAIWQNEMISAVCSQMPNLTIVTANVAAAVDQTKLSVADLDALQQHAVQTASSYCTGCCAICESAVGCDAQIGDVLRYMMYHNSYGDQAYARSLFAELPADFRERMTQIDYTPAEQACPQGIRIGRLMQEAATLLA